MRTLIFAFFVLTFFSCQKDDIVPIPNEEQQKLSLRSALYNPIGFNHKNIAFVHTETVPSSQIQAVKFGAYSKDLSLNSFMVNNKPIPQFSHKQGEFGFHINGSDSEINSFKNSLNLSMDNQSCDFDPISVQFNNLPSEITAGSVISWTTSQNYTGQRILVIANLSDLNASIYDYQYRILDGDNFVIDNTFLDKFSNGSTVYFIVGIAEMVEKGDNLFINGYTNYSFNRKVIK